MKIISDHIGKHVPIIISRHDNFFKRFKGLMFRLKPISNEGILLTPCNSIHMFFMFFPIDVIFLNSRNEIIYTKEKVKPWSLIFPIKNATSVLELPTGSISKYSISVGMKIEF
ncbi:hypothetical protein BTR23_10415 [Alkalihalophilus pseudofirmus]|nr:hypothetical protein BTR23_10415 [Alkalihalophilus pseudofirmus]